MSLYFVSLSRSILIVANYLLLIQWTAAFDPKAFDDSILYKLNWPGDVYAVRFFFIKIFMFSLFDGFNVDCNFMLKSPLQPYLSRVIS